MDYMGTTDPARRAWMLNFVAKLSAPGGLGVYMVALADVVAISTAVNAFVDALAVVETPEGKNKPNVVIKDDLRRAAQQICRQYARMIKYNGGISDEAKVLVNIKPPGTIPERRDCPSGAPTLAAIAATVGAHTLGYSDSLEPLLKRKPVGADGVLLFRVVGTAPAEDFADAKLYRKFTTTPMAVFYDGEDNGKIATYFARWVGQRGDMGSVSLPLSLPIAA